MESYQPHTLQDSTRQDIVARHDSGSVVRDSSGLILQVQRTDSVPRRVRTASAQMPVINTDTTSVCTRNSIEPVTFYDSLNLVNRIDPGKTGKFPYLFTEKNRLIQEEARAVIVRQLRPGIEPAAPVLHEDWIIIVILAVSMLYALIRNSSLNILHGVERYFLFRGIGDPGARDVGGLFNWESTLVNLVSYMVLGLCGYVTASYYGAVPGSLPGIVYWLIVTGAIIASVTVRHIVCYFTGMLSDTREVFSEYVITIYQFYHFGAFFLLILTILMLYTTIVPVNVFIIAGIAVAGLLYLIRILRLLIIFINSSISLYYLILYLCALEILPVIISVKYFSGLV